jgi:thiamine biosynthesis lipoprotein
VADVLRDIDLTLSRFRPDSELSRLNGGAGAWHPVSPLAQRALRIALDAASWTHGLVDPTLGAALIALGYDRTFRLVAADAPDVPVMVAPTADWTSVELDDEAARVRWPPGLVVDLGATAKGYAADLAAEAAHAATGCGVLVNLGGDLASAGAAPTEGWSVLITDRADPFAPEEPGPTQTISVHSGGLATSGTRARRWRRGGSELHHLLDPRSGRPVAGPWRTVSVTASTCVLANTASTCAIVAGFVAPDWLSDRGFAARLVALDGTVRVVGGWPVEHAAGRAS